MTERLCQCGAPLGPTNRTGRCRKCSSKLALERACPADFMARAAVMNSNELAAHYSASAKTVTRWRKETGAPPVKRVGPSTLRPIPDGFALVAPSLTIRELRVRYGCSLDLIRRWCAEARVRPRHTHAHSARNASVAFSAPVGDGSREGLAAEYLRRFGPVFRCDPSGRQNLRGAHWNRGGRVVLTGAELIERAERNGWDADAWKRVA